MFPFSNGRQRWVRPLAHVLLAAVLAACAAPTAGNIGDAGGYQPRDEQQVDACDGIAAPARSGLKLLDPKAKVASAVVCGSITKYVAGHGFWSFSTVTSVLPSRIPALVAGLTQPDADRSADGGCTAMLITVPGFVLTLADGSRIRPGVPGDGCHPSREALAVISGAGGNGRVRERRERQVITELEASSNCGSGAKSPAVWSDRGTPTPGRIPALPTSGSLSICRYHGTGDQEGSLTRVGFRTAAQVNVLMPTLSTTPPTGCDPKADPMQTPTGDWLMFYRAPKSPYRSDGAGSELVALLELSHCRRWVDPGKGLTGYANSAATAALAALADQANKRSA